MQSDGSRIPPSVAVLFVTLNAEGGKSLPPISIKLRAPAGEGIRRLMKIHVIPHAYCSHCRLFYTHTHTQWDTGWSSPPSLPRPGSQCAGFPLCVSRVLSLARCFSQSGLFR